MPIQSTRLDAPDFYFHSRLYNHLDRFARDRPKLTALIAIGGLIFPPVTITSLYFLNRNWSHLKGLLLYQRLGLPYTPPYNRTQLKPRRIFDENGVELARLEVNEGELPRLIYHPSIKEPAERGFLQGRLLADKVEDLGLRVLKVIEKYMDVPTHPKHDMAHRYSCAEFPVSTDSELQGILEGVEVSLNEIGLDLARHTKELLWRANTLTDLINDRRPDLPKLEACSTVVVRDPVTKECIFGRNFDFVSLGLLGEQQFIEEYTGPRGGSISTITFPGYAGAFTTWSDDLFISINLMGRCVRASGTPATLLVRQLIEQCSSVDDVEELLENEKSLSSITLTVVDRNDAAILHLYPEGTDEIVVRRLSEENPLIATNSAHRLGCNLPIPGTETDTSEERFCAMRKTWTEVAENEIPLQEKVAAMLRSAGKVTTIWSGIFTNTMELKRSVFANFHADKLI